MSDRRKEQYVEDRLGNLSREIGDPTGQDGMSVDDGIVTIPSGDTGSPVVVKEIDPDARGEYIIRADLLETSGAAGSFIIYSATTDDTGTITSTTQRSILIEADANELVQYDYVGREFSEDAIAVTASTTAEVGIATYVDHREDEP